MNEEELKQAVESAVKQRNSAGEPAEVLVVGHESYDFLRRLGHKLGLKVRASRRLKSNQFTLTNVDRLSEW